MPVALRAGSLDLHLIVTCDKLRSGADAHAVLLGHVDWQLRALRRALRFEVEEPLLADPRLQADPHAALKSLYDRLPERYKEVLAPDSGLSPEAMFGALLAYRILLSVAREPAFVSSKRRAEALARSVKIQPPKAAAASVLVIETELIKLSSSSTTRMPRPPPPAAAFTITG